MDILAEAASKGIRMDASRRAALEEVLATNSQVLSLLEAYSHERTRSPGRPRMNRLSMKTTAHTNASDTRASGNMGRGSDSENYPSSVRAFTHVFDAPIRHHRADAPAVGTAALKDMIAVRGHVNTVGTAAFRADASTENAEVTDRLLESNWSIVGMTNMHALAFGTTGLSSQMGPAVNALDPAVLPGGSSSGSAVAVAAGDVDVAVGTDTGGSVRIPAALNGVVGFKPTFGRVPVNGVVPLAPTLDHVGTFGRNVASAGEAFAAIDGAARSPFEEFEQPPHLRIGVPHDHFLDELDEMTRASFDRLLVTMKNCEWIDVVETDVDGTKYVLAAQMALLMSEGSRTYRYMSDTDREALPEDVRLRIDAGLFIEDETVDYARSFKRDWIKAIDVRLEEFDVLLTPTVAVAEPRVGQSSVRTAKSSIPTGVVLSRLTSPFNLSGHPAVTLPYWEAHRRIPLGVQLIGARNHDRLLLSIAKQLESMLPDRVKAESV